MSEIFSRHPAVISLAVYSDSVMHGWRRESSIMKIESDAGKDRLIERKEHLKKDKKLLQKIEA